LINAAVGDDGATGTAWRCATTLTGRSPMSPQRRSRPGRRTPMSSPARIQGRTGSTRTRGPSWTAAVRAAHRSTDPAETLAYRHRVGRRAGRLAGRGHRNARSRSAGRTQPRHVRDGLGQPGQPAHERHGRYGCMDMRAAHRRARCPAWAGSDFRLRGPPARLLGGDAGDVRYPYYLINGRLAAQPRTFSARPGARVTDPVHQRRRDTAFAVALAGIG